MHTQAQRMYDAMPHVEAMTAARDMAIRDAALRAAIVIHGGYPKVVADKAAKILRDAAVTAKDRGYELPRDIAEYAAGLGEQQ